LLATPARAPTPCQARDIVLQLEQVITDIGQYGAMIEQATAVIAERQQRRAPRPPAPDAAAASTIRFAVLSLIPDVLAAALMDAPLRLAAKTP
jgi:hypothetical protein